MLINCVAYEDGTRLADCPTDAIGEFVKRPRCFVWVACLSARRLSRNLRRLS